MPALIRFNIVLVLSTSAFINFEHRILSFMIHAGMNVVALEIQYINYVNVYLFSKLDRRNS